MMKPAKHKSVMVATVSVGLDGSESNSVESPRTVRLKPQDGQANNHPDQAT
jgi:hypothetical protein